MRIFIDTSSLLKKYYLEEGSAKVLKIFKKTTEVVVSPITYIELYNTLQRLFTEKKLPKKDFLTLLQDIHSDFQFFQKVSWDHQLENACVTLINKYTLKSLDCIQLASAKSSECEHFVTSDHKQHQIAAREFKKAILM